MRRSFFISLGVLPAVLLNIPTCAETPADRWERANMLEMLLIEIHCGPRVAATERRGRLGLQEPEIRTAATYCPFRLWNLADLFRKGSRGIGC